MAIEEVLVGSKKAFIHPAKRKNVVFLLGHGASGDANAGNLPAIADCVVQAGVTSARYNASGPIKSRIKTLKDVMDSKEGDLNSTEKWILSGHSMGGRTACAVARERPDSIAAVVLFSYPLHPPGKQEELRDEDLTALTCPVLIVRGSKDPFSTQAPFDEVMQRMSTKTLQIVSVEAGDHSLSTKTGPGKERFNNFMGEVTRFITSVLEADDEQTTKEASPSTKVTSPDASLKTGPKKALRKRQTSEKTAEEKDGRQKRAKKAKQSKAS